MTKVYYVLLENELESFPYKVGKTYNQEWLQEHFEELFGSCLVCNADENIDGGEFESQHFCGPATLGDAVNNFSDEEENQPCIVLEGTVTGNHEPFYFSIDTFNHGPELAIINARRFNSVKELFKLL
jgi:hypothetical protein